MTNIYKCDYCGKLFQGINAFFDCEEHEEEHKKDVYAELKCNYSTEICDKCNHVYYAYNIERRCEFADKCNKDNYWCKFCLKEQKHYEKSND